MTYTYSKDQTHQTTGDSTAQRQLNNNGSTEIYTQTNYSSHGPTYECIEEQAMISSIEGELPDHTHP